VQTGQRKD